MERRSSMGTASLLLFAWALVPGPVGCVDYGGLGGPADGADACAGVDCSGHGSCELVDGQPRCRCDAGYQRAADDALACVAAAEGGVLVDVVKAISYGQQGPHWIGLHLHDAVELEQGGIHQAHLAMLETSLEYRSPVYLEIDPQTRLIQQVLVPYESPVARLIEHDDRVEVHLVYSAAIHYLERAHPDFEQMYADLAASAEQGHELLVTETRDTHLIIDVRPPLEL